MLVIGNLSRRLAERRDAKIDGRYLSDFARMWKSEVIRTSTLNCSARSIDMNAVMHRNLRLVRGPHQRAWLRKSA